MQSKFLPMNTLFPLLLGRSARKWYLLGLSLFFVLSAQATHIVGGEIGYRCLGNNQYEVTLRVYRDCFYGDDLAPFDDPASIGIFDRNGLLVRNLLVTKTGNDTLTNIIDKCILNSGNVCVHTTTYKATVTLMPRPGGYRFVYQRCCRNETIRNIVKPLETGATYDIHLTEAAMKRCNNSPVFNAWPPIFICRDEPLSFNHSALDTDGDSLVYKLCIPFQGGTILFPQPVPPDAPPYDTVVWNNPPNQTIYSVDNMMGFGVPLAINPVSGLMTATPGQLGQYVIGVCILEYDRNTKELLSETRRDFQYNVIDCQRVTAALFAPEAQCDNLTVSFLNQSQNAEAFQWYFDSPSTTFGSTERNPVFTYPDTGKYTITLIAEPGTICADTAVHDLFLQYNSLSVDLQVDVFDCFGGSVLQLRDLSVDTISPVVKWQWEVRFTGGEALVSTQQFPEFIVPTGSSGTVKLTATSQNGCVQTAEKSFETGQGKPGGYIASTRLEACLDEVIGLNPGTPSTISFRYHWEPAEGLSDTSAVNPTLTVTKDAVYKVTITPLNGLCDTVVEVAVVVVDQTPASFSQTLQCDGLSVQLANTTPGAPLARWIIGDPANPVLDTMAATFTYTFPSAGTYPVTLVTLNRCPDTLAGSVSVPGPFLNADFTLSLAGCSASENQIRFEDRTSNLLNNTNSWFWRASDGQTSTQKDPIFLFDDQTDSVTITLIAGTSQGCRDTIVRKVSVKLVDFPRVSPPATVLVCPGVPTSLNINGSPSYQYAWSPAAGLSATGIPNPVVTATSDIIYQVTISDATGVCDTLVNVQVVVADFKAVAPPSQVLVCPEIPTPLNPNGNNLYVYSWSPATGLSDANVGNPSVTTSQDVTYQVRISDPLNNCDTTVTVQVKVVDFKAVAPPSMVVVCGGVPTEINPNGNSQYRYEWSPASGLSSANAANPLVTASTEITYQVRISDPLDNCDTTVSVLVKVIDFGAEAPPDTVLVCPGIATPMHPDANPALRYSWTPVAGLSDPSAGNPLVTATVDQRYQVTVSDLTGFCDTVFTVQVKIADFKAVAPASMVVVCPNIPTPVNPGGSDLYRYTWTPATGLSATNVPNPMVTISEAITYQVRISDPLNNCDTTVTVQVKMADFKPVAPANMVVVCPNTPTPVNPGGSDLYRYTWTPATGLSAANVPNPTVTTSLPITYQVRISDLSGQCDTTVTVQVKMVDFKAVAPASMVVVCPNISTPVNPGGSDLYRYTWTPGTGLSATNVPNPTVTTSQGITYQVRVSDLSGQCDTTVTVEVKIVGFKAIAPANMVVVCPNTPTPVNPGGSDLYRYTWTPATGLSATNVPNPTVTTSQPVTYQVRISDLSGQCDTTVTVQVKIVDFKAVAPANMVVVCPNTPTPVNPGGSDLYRYTWTPATGLSAANVPNPTVTTSLPITYQVRISDLSGQCDTTVAVQVKIVDFKAVAPANMVVVCPNTPTPVNPNGSDLYRYTWTPATGLSATNVPNPTVTTSQGITYQVRISDLSGQCDTTVTVQVKMVDFKAVAPANMVVVCPNTPTPVNPGGSDLYRYTWTPATGLSAANVPNPTVTTSLPITYQVRISDLSGQCDTTVAVQVKVVDFKPVAPASMVVVCPNTPTPVNPNGSDLYRYTWTPATGLSATNVPNPTVTTSQGITYQVRISDLSGQCDTTVTVQVKIVDFKAVAPANMVVVCPNTPTPVNPGGSDLYRYTWTPATGLSATNVPNPTVTTSQAITYQVRISDLSGQCDTTVTVQVKIVDFKAVAPASMVVVCPNISTPVNPGGSDLYRYTWTPATGLSATNVPNPTVTTSQAITYQVRISDLSGQCDTTVTVQVKIVDFKAVAPANMVVVCPNIPTPVNPGGSDLYRYIWTPATGLSATNVPNPTVTTSQAITYQVRISDLSGQCDTTVTVQVKIVDFKAVAPANMVVVCPNIPTPVNPGGSDLYRYTWTPATGLSATNVPNPTVITNEAITYQVRISDLSGQCDTTVAVQVKMVDFKAVAPANMVVVCPNTPTPVNPGGSDLYRYTWTPATGLSATNVPNPTVTTSQPVTYQVRISDLSGQCDTTVTVQVKIVDFKAVAPANMVVVCPNTPTPVNPGGSDLYRYTWSPATGLSATNVPNPTVTTSQGITYQVRISDLSGQCDTTVTVQVKIVDFKAVAPANMVVVCPNTPTPVNPGGSDLYRYTWTPATGLSATNVPNPTVTTSQPVTYQVRISDLSGQCDTTVTVQVKIVDFKVVAPASMILVCPDIPTPVNPNGSDLYRYIWTPATGLSATNVPNPTVTANLPVTYQVRISDLSGLCDTTVTVQVKIVDFKAVGPDTLQTVCRGIPTPLNPRGDSQYHYTWSPATGLSATDVANPLITTLTGGIYTVTISEPSRRCDTVITIRVVVPGAINPDAGVDTTLCALGNYALQGKGTGAARFEWSDNPGFTNLLGQNAQLNLNVARGVRKIYLRVTDANNCPETDPVTISAFPVLASLPATAQSCLPGEMIDLLVVNGDAGQQLQYRWSPANLLISDPNTGPGAIIRAQDQSAIQVEVRNQYGCLVTLRTNITVVNLPDKLTISADKNPIRLGESAVITVGGCVGCAYDWTPSTGLSNTNSSTVTATPEETTTYVARVTKDGCVDTISITIVVEICSEPFLPNAFTPNGDKINDVLYVRVKDYEELHFIIYNRWGQEVFDTRNPEVGWDGTYRGRQLPPDVYGFYIYMRCPDGTEFKKRGNISLIR
ncbi:MAG: gliding motility-associated C-terminal domain-containing protein [Haliscomenobacter sp.]|nr:gliding motility-associated C-terminal domain-containing protein [Haliscomenobacter sp.]